MKELVMMIEEYESGLMDDAEMIGFFQYLVDTNMISQLQGSYQRVAQDLIENGLVTLPHRGPMREHKGSS